MQHHSLANQNIARAGFVNSRIVINPCMWLIIMYDKCWGVSPESVEIRHHQIILETMKRKIQMCFQFNVIRMFFIWFQVDSFGRENIWPNTFMCLCVEECVIRIGTNQPCAWVVFVCVFVCLLFAKHMDSESKRPHWVTHIPNDSNNNEHSDVWKEKESQIEPF